MFGLGKMNKLAKGSRTHIGDVRAKNILKDVEGTPFTECPICELDILCDGTKDVAIGIRPDKEEVQWFKEWTDHETVEKVCSIFNWGKNDKGKKVLIDGWYHYKMVRDINKETGEIIDEINILVYVDFRDMHKIVDKEW